MDERFTDSLRYPHDEADSALLALVGRLLRLRGGERWPLPATERRPRSVRMHGLGQCLFDLWSRRLVRAWDEVGDVERRLDQQCGHGRGNLVDEPVRQLVPQIPPRRTGEQC